MKRQAVVLFALLFLCDKGEEWICLMLLLLVQE